MLIRIVTCSWPLGRMSTLVTVGPYGNAGWLPGLVIRPGPVQWLRLRVEQALRGGRCHADYLLTVAGAGQQITAFRESDDLILAIARAYLLGAVVLAVTINLIAGLGAKF